MDLDLVALEGAAAAYYTDAAQFQFPSLPSIASVYENVRILFTDILPNVFTTIVPNICSWNYRTWYSGAIQSQTLTSTAHKVAYLFQHGQVRPKADGSVPALLLLPGDHAHPYSLLHLADIAAEEGRAVFSVHLPYDDDHPEDHRALLKESIAKVEEWITGAGGTLSHLILAGHSRGGSEAAHAAYVVENPRIDAVISIAGRLEVNQSATRPCRESLKASIQAVWDKIKPVVGLLRIPLCQMAASEDWCMDPEVSIVRLDQPHLLVYAGHLGIINAAMALEQFRLWVRQ